MKTALAILALCAVTQGAFAKGPDKGPDCRTIESTNARLACYDAASLTKTNPAKMKKPATVGNNVSPAVYVDPFAAEEARTAAKLNNICRGC